LIRTHLLMNWLSTILQQYLGRNGKRRRKKARRTLSTAPIEVQTQHTLVGNTKWPKAVSERTEDVHPTIVIRGWKLVYRSGRKALFNPDTNAPRLHRERRAAFDVRSAMFDARRATFEYFLPSEEVSGNIVKEHIIRYCGSAAEVTTVVSRCIAWMISFIKGEANVS
jgi:hypothetical protein